MRSPSLLALAAALALSAHASAQELRWSFQTGGAIYASPSLSEGAVYIGSSDGHVYSIDATSGRERWRFRTGGAVDSSPAVADGVVYALSRDGLVYALDAEGGEVRWTFRTGGEKKADYWDFFLSDPRVHGDLVLFGSGDGHLYALDRHSGEPRWKVQTGDVVHAAPVISDGVVYVGSFDGLFYAVRLDTGEVVWRFDTIGDTYFPRGEVQRGAAVHDGIVYFGSRDYNIYAVDAEKGTGRWNLKDPRGWITPEPLVMDSTVYFGTSDPEVFYAMDRRKGTVRWKLPVHTRVFGGAVKVGGDLVFGGINGKLHGVDPASGALRWTFQTEASRASFASVYDPSGGLSAEMKELYASGRGLEAEDRLLSLGSIPGTPAARGRTIFFGSTDGQVYAVEAPAP